MRKIIKRILQGLGALLPVLILVPSIAMATPGYVGDAPDCTVWRQGMPHWSLGGSYCNGANATNKRFYELEVALDALRAENAQLRASLNATQGMATAPATTPTLDWETLQRILALETQVKALSAQTAPKAIPGCDKRTTGFSVTTGQSCIGNVVKK